MSEGPKIYLREWREFHNLTQTELARRVGVTKGEISRLESGLRKMTIEWVSKLSNVFSMRAEQLMAPPPVYRNIAEKANDFSRRSAGLSLGIVPTPSSDLVEVDGDEMGETLRPGEIVVIDKSRTVPSPAGIFAIKQHGTTVIRRLQPSPNSNEVHVSCDNRAYNAFEVPLDQIQIVGRAVAKVVRI